MPSVNVAVVARKMLVKQFEKGLIYLLMKLVETVTDVLTEVSTVVNVVVMKSVVVNVKSSVIVTGYEVVTTRVVEYVMNIVELETTVAVVRDVIVSVTYYEVSILSLERGGKGRYSEVIKKGQ